MAYRKPQHGNWRERMEERQQDQALLKAARKQAGRTKPTKKALARFASENKANPTAAEAALWDLLCTSRLAVYFERQVPLSRYIVDLYCKSHRIIVEIDGGYHFEASQRSKDIERQRILEQRGDLMIRFTNQEVLEQSSVVLEVIQQAINVRKYSLRGWNN